MSMKMMKTSTWLWSWPLNEAYRKHEACVDRHLTEFGSHLSTKGNSENKPPLEIALLPHTSCLGSRLLIHSPDALTLTTTETSAWTGRPLHLNP